jgi:hypothetical protein
MPLIVVPSQAIAANAGCAGRSCSVIPLQEAKASYELTAP